MNPDFMPHIAVNTRLLLPGRVEGISRFAYEVLFRMTQQHPEVQFSFFFDRPFDPQFIFGSNVKGYVIPPPSRHPILWYAWFHLQLPRMLKRVEADLFFSPEFYLSTYDKIPQVPVFHDLAYEHYPQDLAPFASWYCRHYSPIYAQLATRILTVSAFSKQDIQEQYGISPSKIDVVYNGAKEIFRPLSVEKQQEIRDTYTGGAPYFHYVGSIHPRKNIDSVLKAFDRFKSQVESPMKFLIVGRKAWKYDAALAVYEQMEHKEDVIFSGFVSDEVLTQLYGASNGLVYVPHLEGFGIPILEAMESDIPVITSNKTSLPEVAGDAAILVPPSDYEQLAQAMIRLHGNPSLQKQLIEKGRIQRQKYSWDATYSSVWGTIRSLLS